MSTRSRIAVEYMDGSVESIYCHFDGYLDGVGRKLYFNYRCKDKVKQLIKLGDISALGSHIGERVDGEVMENYNRDQVIAYSRDKGENVVMTKSKSYKDINSQLDRCFNSGEEYFYVFRVSECKWYYAEYLEENGPYGYRLPVLKKLTLDVLKKLYSSPV